MKILGALLLFVFIALSVADKVRYDNHTVIRVSLTKEQAAYIDTLQFDVWNDYLAIGENDLRLSPEQLQIIKQMGLDYEVLIPNVQDLIDQEERDQLKAPAAFFDAYRRYSEIVSFLSSLTTYPNTRYVSSIGSTIDGRNIPAIVIQYPNTKATIFISGGQHAREWIAPTTVLYILNHMLTSTDSRVRSILNDFTLVFVPLVNPDGYEFSHTNTRLWRKNRRNNGGGVYGVDLNRNWDYKWGGGGSSGTPSSDTYRGTAPFSEPESRAVSNYFKTFSPGAAIDYHSYSQLILRPWGDTTTNPPNNANLVSLGSGIRTAIINAGGVPYTSQKAIDLYVTTGTASDWYFVNTNNRYGYTIELRDTGSYGFVLPVSQIVPTGNENIAGFLYFAEFIRNNP